MNREIKFKAKRRDNGEWVEGGIIHKNNGVYVYNPQIVNKRGYSVQSIKVDHLTVCQFTGLKDVNGEELYENDIITAKTILGKKLKGKIIYLNACYFLGIMDEQGREKAIRELLLFRKCSLRFTSFH